MDINIKELRIRNYKCYESIDLDLKDSNLLILVGANPAEAHVVLFNKIKKLNYYIKSLIIEFFSYSNCIRKMHIVERSILKYFMIS